MGDGVGNCPTGCGPVRIDVNGEVKKAERLGECRMCRQRKNLVYDLLCVACDLGRRFAFRYECSRCHGLQRIPHPMWRYCSEPSAFSSATWACHQGCQDYTHWRVHPDDAERVPPWDSPPSWGQRELWLSQIRARRRAEMVRRAGGGDLSPGVMGSLTVCTTRCTPVDGRPGSQASQPQTANSGVASGAGWLRRLLGL